MKGLTKELESIDSFVELKENLKKQKKQWSNYQHLSTIEQGSVEVIPRAEKNTVK